MKRRLKNVAIMLSLFTMIGTTGEAAGRPKKPLNEKLTADKVKGKASKPRSYALPSKVVAQLNRTNKRVNENWYDIKKNAEAIVEEGKIRQAIDKVLGDSIKYEVIERKEVDEKQDKAIASNGSAIKHLDRKVNKGTSMLVAMSNVDFQDVNTGEVAIGAGVGHYVGDQAVAVGVAYGVNDDLKIHAKWSGVAGDPHYNAIGGGVTYKFRTR